MALNDKSGEENFKNLNEFKKLHEEVNSSAKSYLELLKEIANNNKIIKDFTEDTLELEKKHADYLKLINKIEKKQVDLLEKDSDENRKILEQLKKQKNEYYKLNSQELDRLATNKKLVAQYEEQNDKLKKQVTLGNTLSSTFKGVGNVLKTGYSKYMSNIHGSIMGQLKAVKQTSLSMGLLSNRTKGLSEFYADASYELTSMGMSVQDLTELQGTYSDEIGRAVLLTEKGAQRMAAMGKATTLGNQGAAQLAANMDLYGVSAERTADYVEETMNSSSMMGLNASAVVKDVAKNIKLANKFHFKGGVQGLTKMAQRAQKLGLSMEGIAGFAEKLFDPEGAIDVSSQLQVMGGEWAKLADPFKLMYQARNDIDGLHESIANAAAGTAQFNKETGEFEISGLELHRLRKIAEATGLDFNELSESAKNVAKFSKIEAQIGANIDPKYTELITSLGQINKDGTVSIKLDGGTEIKNIKDLTNKQLKLIEQEQATLEKRASDATTFDDKFGALLENIKAQLLPGLEILNDSFGDIIEVAKDTFGSNSFFDKDSLKEMGKQLGNAAKILKEVLTGEKSVFDIFSGGETSTAAKGIAAAVGGGLALAGIGKAAMWVTNGLALAQGFNMGASVGGSGSMGGLFNKGGFGKGKGLSLGKSLKGGLGVGAIAGLGSMGLDMLRGSREQENDGYGKAMGIGSSALEGAAMGAMLGSIIPGLGTAIGAGVGGALGAGYGIYDEFFNNEGNAGIMQDYIMRPGQPAVPFSSKDTVVGFKPNGAIEQAMVGSNNSSSGEMKVSFAPLEINGNISLSSGGGNIGSLDLSNNPTLIRELSQLIQEQIRMGLSGGKLSPNKI